MDSSQQPKIDRRAWRLIVVLASTVGVLFVLLVSTVVVAHRVRVEAPNIIGEIASERRHYFEAELAARSGEARELVGASFTFMYRLWSENPVLAGMRTRLEAATYEMKLLGGEVSAAFSTPTKSLGPLLDRGPTRVRVVLDHAVAVARELKDVVPVVLQSLDGAASSFRDADGSTLQMSLATIDGLLQPVMGEHVGLRADWDKLRVEIIAWSDRVGTTLTTMRQQMSGDALHDDFSRRLRQRLF